MPIAQVQISRSALLHNLAVLRSLHPSAKVMGVVKGNAYGHGQAEATLVLDGQVDMFFVDDLDELRLLRKTSNTPALVGGYVPASEVAEAVSLDAAVVLYDEERLEALEKAAGQVGKPARVHLKIDALLGRQGLLPGQLPHFCEALKRHPGIQVEAAYAHFANIEDTTDPVHAMEQVELFARSLACLASFGYENLPRHISSTSGVMVFEAGRAASTAGAAEASSRDHASAPRGVEARTSDFIRLGIGLYGLYPSEALARSFNSLELKPAMRWVTQLAQVKELPAGHPVGYGLTYMTSRPTRVGIVPQGYSDGYDRGLSNAADVLVNGARCPVIGRVAMNMFMVDLTQAPNARPEDEVVLIGQQGSNRITAEEMARRIGTINYEVVTRVSPLLRRVLVD